MLDRLVLDGLCCHLSRTISGAMAWNASFAHPGLGNPRMAPVSATEVVCYSCRALRARVRGPEPFVNAREMGRYLDPS